MDTVRTSVVREVQTAFLNHREVSIGTITSYNPTTHTARATLQPEGESTLDLHIAILWAGLRAPLEPGMSCLIAWDKGEPRVIIGTWYDDNRPAPTAPFVFGDDVHVLGALTLAGQLTPAVLVNLPPASAVYANALVVTAPQGTTDGQLYFCQPSHDGVTYTWRKVTLV